MQILTKGQNLGGEFCRSIEQNFSLEEILRLWQSSFLLTSKLNILKLNIKKPPGVSGCNFSYPFQS